MSITEYPDWLRIRPIQQWPRELTVARTRSPFSAAWSSTSEQLRAELRHLGTRDAPATMVMQIAITDEDLRQDGRLRAGRTPDHPGVILEIESRHGVLSYPCDTYDRWRDNVRAIVLTLEKLRAIDRYGVTASGQQYTGWAQLEAAPMGRGLAMTVDAAYATLREIAGVGGTGSVLSLRWLLRQAQAAAHPDRNRGDDTNWNRVENAGKALKAAGQL